MSEEATLDEFVPSSDGDESQEQVTSWVWGDIPKDWRLVDGSDVYDVNPNPKPEEEPNTYIEMDALNTELPWPRYFRTRNASEYSGKTFTKGDTLFARITPCTENGKAAIVPEMETKVGIGSTEYAVLSPKRDSINPWLLYHISKSYPIHNYAVSRMRGSTGRQRVPFSVFRRELDIALPPLPEQRKIAAVLHNVDQAIQKTEQVIEQAERAKEGVIQESVLDKIAKASSPTELGEVPDDWETVKLEDVASKQEDSLVDGPFGSSLKAEEFVENGLARILQLQNVKEGWYSDSNIRYVDKETYEELERHSAKPGDIFIAKMASPVARTCILPDKYEHYMLGCADVVKLVPNEEFVDDFVVYCLNSYPVWKQAAAHIRGSGRLRVNLNQLKEVELPKPPRREQEKVVSAVNGITDYIESHKNEKERLSRLKKGLRQDLLSGTVRTTDTNIEVPEEIAQYG
jgi:type I restriction enzyme S subunit